MSAFTIFTVGLSYLTGFWLTYMDFSVWAIAIGVIKVGPATAAIRRHEAQSATTYHVARRPARDRLGSLWMGIARQRACQLTVETRRRPSGG